MGVTILVNYSCFALRRVWRGELLKLSIISPSVAMDVPLGMYTSGPLLGFVGVDPSFGNPIATCLPLYASHG